jgi:cell division protein FtsX
MLALSAAVLLMLLIASANAANLVLMRNEARRTELAVRMALGAGRGRIVAQVLTESLVLAIAAGGTGLALTWWSLQPLVRLVPDGLPRVESVQLDWTVCLIAIGIALGTAAISGLAPALSISSDLVSHLRSAGRGVAGSASRALRRSFVVVQVALAVTIVAAAGLLTRTVLNLQSIDTGLAADRLVLVELSVPSADHANRVRHSQFLDTVVRQLEALPFVEAATPSTCRHFRGPSDGPCRESRPKGRPPMKPRRILRRTSSRSTRTISARSVRGSPPGVPLPTRIGKARKR